MLIKSGVPKHFNRNLCPLQVALIVCQFHLKWAHFQGKQLCCFHFCFLTNRDQCLKERICSLSFESKIRPSFEGVSSFPGKPTGSHESCSPLLNWLKTLANSADPDQTAP